MLDGMHDETTLSRRRLLQLGALASLGFLLPRSLEAGEPGDAAPPGASRKAVIVLWLAGGPSQYETFDPRPGTKWGGRVGAIPTRAPGVQIADLYPRLADEMGSVALVRSVVTPEGEHQRGTYLLRTGYRPSPTVVHPSLGAVAAHELAAPDLDIPAHVAIGAASYDPPRGGLLGPSFDAFALGESIDPRADVSPRVPPARLDERLRDLAAVDAEFARGRGARPAETDHAGLAARGRAAMTSPRLDAFDWRKEPEETRARYGETGFGRGCLVARRLVEVGVRAIEVSLGGWDSHVANHEAHRKGAQVLDPAAAALLRDLRERDLLRTTLVVIAGEFGRSPAINRLEGRDHFSRGFSVALAGAGIRGGVVVGETDPAGEKAPTEPVSPGDLFATIYGALGLDATRQNVSKMGRPIALADGKPVARLFGD